MDRKVLACLLWAVFSSIFLAASVTFTIFLKREPSVFRQISTKNVPQPRFGQSAITFNDRMYIFGGYSIEAAAGANYLNDVWYLDLDQHTWVEVSTVQTSPSYPSGRSGHFATQYGGSMYICGGSSTYGTKYDFWSFNLTTNQWKSLGNLPQNLYSIGGTVYGSNLYILGLYNYGSSSSYQGFYTWSFVNSTWTGVYCCGGMTFRDSFATASFNNSFWVYGGYTGSTKNNDLWSYNFGSAQWQQFGLSSTAMTVQIQPSTMAYFDGSLFIVDEWNTFWIMEFDPSIRSYVWNEFDSQSQDKCTISRSAASYEDQLIFFGGVDWDTAYTESVKDCNQVWIFYFSDATEDTYLWFVLMVTFWTLFSVTCYCIPYIPYCCVPFCEGLFQKSSKNNNNNSQTVPTITPTISPSNDQKETKKKKEKKKHKGPKSNQQAGPSHVTVPIDPYGYQAPPRPIVPPQPQHSTETQPLLNHASEDGDAGMQAGAPNNR